MFIKNIYGTVRNFSIQIQYIIKYKPVNLRDRWTIVFYLKDKSIIEWCYDRKVDRDDELDHIDGILTQEDKENN